MLRQMPDHCVVDHTVCLEKTHELDAVTIKKTQELNQNAQVINFLSIDFIQQDFFGWVDKNNVVSKQGFHNPINQSAIHNITEISRGIYNFFVFNGILVKPNPYIKFRKISNRKKQKIEKPYEP
jgi:hypothetical protein